MRPGACARCSGERPKHSMKASVARVRAVMASMSVEQETLQRAADGAAAIPEAALGEPDSVRLHRGDALQAYPLVHRMAMQVDREIGIDELPAFGARQRPADAVGEVGG